MGEESAGAGSEEDFEELRVFLEGQRARHRRVIATMLGGSAALVAGGAALLLTGRGGVAGGFLLALGALGVGRALLSAWTDIDTRDRGEFEAMKEELDRDLEKKLGGAP